MSANGTTQLLTAEQLAERWRVSLALVYRLTREGKLPAVKLGRYYRYRVEAVEEFEVGGGVGREEVGS
jgi:excisionase family DNA binding protein